MPGSSPTGALAPNLVLSSVLGDSSRALWKQIYDKDVRALPTLSPQWAEAVTATGAYRDVSLHFRLPDGHEVIVPLFAGRGLGISSSMPDAWGFGGVIGTRQPNVGELAAILSELQRRTSVQIRLRPNPQEAELWDVAASDRWIRLPRLAHIVDLSGGFADVWAKRFRPRTRTTIRKAEQSGLEVISGYSPELVTDFHGLLMRSIDRWAAYQNEPLALARWRARRRDPVEKFHRIAAALGGSCRIWIARHQGEPTAAILVLQDQNAHYTRGAMNEELAGPTAANYLLHHLAIQAACKAGCGSYQMGETGRSHTLSQFKSRFGAEATPYAEFLFERVPLHWLDRHARATAKRLMGFRDV